MNLWGSSFFPTSLHVNGNRLPFPSLFLTFYFSTIFLSAYSLYFSNSSFSLPLSSILPPSLSSTFIRPLYVFSYLPLPGFELQFFSPNFTTLSTRPISLSLNICPLNCTNDNCNRIICIYMPVHLYYEFKTIKAFLLLNQFFLYFEWSLFWELVQCMQYDINTIWVFQTIK